MDFCERLLWGFENRGWQAFLGKIYGKLRSHDVWLFLVCLMNKILTLYNLRRWGIIILNWYCMCQSNGESVDNLFLTEKTLQENCGVLFFVCLGQCGSCQDLWMVYWLAGMVTLENIIRLKFWRLFFFFFFFWLNVLKVILLCLMSTIWRERNACTFKDSELLDMKLKFLLLHSLYEWEQATSSTSLTDFLEFLDQLNFRC